MERAVIKIGIGISIPLTVLACYTAGKIGVIVGRYEAYREIVKEKSNDDSKD